MSSDPITAVLTPATARDLANLASIKIDLGITGGESDALLARLIRRASDTIAAAVGRTLGLQTVNDTWRHRCAPPCRTPAPLILSAWPVVLPGVVVTDLATNTPIAAADYDLDAGAGLLTLRRHRGDVSVTYSSGFILPGETGQTLPGEIEEICTTLVSLALTSQGRDATIKSETVEGVGSFTYRDGGGAMQLDEVQLARLGAYSCR